MNKNKAEWFDLVMSIMGIVGCILFVMGFGYYMKPYNPVLIYVMLGLEAVLGIIAFILWRSGHEQSK